MLRTIQNNELSKIYDSIKGAFPLERVKPLNHYLNLLKEGGYIGFIANENGKDVGFVLGCASKIHEDNNKAVNGLFFLDYIFVYPEFRDCGYGNKIIKDLFNSPLAKRGIIFDLPHEPKEIDMDNNEISTYFRLKQFFLSHDAYRITHNVNDHEFVYCYPSTLGGLIEADLYIIKNPHYDGDVYYDQVASALINAERCIHQDTIEVEKAIESYKDTIIKNTAPYFITAHNYEVRDARKEDAEFVSECLLRGTNQLGKLLMDEEIYYMRLMYENNLLDNSVFALKHMKIIINNGKLPLSLLWMVNELPNNSKETLLNAMKEVKMEVPTNFEKGMTMLKELFSNINPNEYRLLILNDGDYYSHKAYEFLPYLPKDKSLSILTDKEDTYYGNELLKAGFKKRLEKESQIEFYKPGRSIK